MHCVLFRNGFERGLGGTWPLLALVLGAQLVAACGGSDASKKASDTGPQGEYRDRRAQFCNGRGGQIVAVDGDDDGRIDIRQYLRGGVQRCATFDLNHDGRLDMVQVYEPNGATLLQGVYDFDFDGRADQLSFFKAGRAREHHLDTDFDRRIDTWISCDEDGWVSRIERQRKRRDGRDIFESYKRGVLVEAEYDTNADGMVNRWERYEDGKLVLVRFDEDRDGKSDREESEGFNQGVGKPLQPFSCDVTTTAAREGASSAAGAEGADKAAGADEAAAAEGEAAEDESTAPAGENAADAQPEAAADDAGAPKSESESEAAASEDADATTESEAAGSDKDA